MNSNYLLSPKLFPPKSSLPKPPKYLIFLIIIAIITGIILRFYNLDGHLYSLDETFSTTHIFGRDVADIIDVKIVSVEEMQSYQKVNPQESFLEATYRIISKPFVFPPLYSILMQIWARFWSNFLDNPAVITRSFSALLSLLSLPCMYWLCWELFLSTEIAWIGTALMAVSPFHLQYAEIVRTYSFMTLTTLFASAVFLRVIRFPSRKIWLLYSLSIAAGLYSNLLFLFVIFAHASYVLFSQKWRFNQVTKSYIFFSLLGFASFLPWLIIFFSQSDLFAYSVAQPTAKNLSLFTLIPLWIKKLFVIFIDLVDPWIEFTKNFRFLQYTLIPLVLSVIAASLLLLIIYIRNYQSIFIISLIFFGGIILMMRDVISGSGFSERLRYMIPYVIGIQLSILFAYFKLKDKTLLTQKISRYIIVILLLGGLLSSFTISQSQSWWAFGAPDYPIMAEKINQQIKPVVIYDDFGDALTMSYLLDNNVYFHLTRNPQQHLILEQGKIYADYTDILLFKPSKKTIQLIERESNFTAEPVFKSSKEYPNLPSLPNLVKINIQ